MTLGAGDSDLLPTGRVPDAPLHLAASGRFNGPGSGCDYSKLLNPRMPLQIRLLRAPCRWRTRVQSRRCELCEGSRFSFARWVGRQRLPLEPGTALLAHKCCLIDWHGLYMLAFVAPHLGGLNRRLHNLRLTAADRRCCPQFVSCLALPAFVYTLVLWHVLNRVATTAFHRAHPLRRLRETRLLADHHNQANESKKCAERKRLANREILPLADRGRDRTEDQHAGDDESQTHVFLPIQFATAHTSRMRHSTKNEAVSASIALCAVATAYSYNW